jgi:hypothetical protein
MTIREWLHLLPPALSIAALKNLDNRPGQDAHVGSLHTAIEAAFTWMTTPEGGAFWSEVHTEVSKMEMGMRYNLNKYNKKLISKK